MIYVLSEHTSRNPPVVLQMEEVYVAMQSKDLP